MALQINAIYQLQLTQVKLIDITLGDKQPWSYQIYIASVKPS